MINDILNQYKPVASEEVIHWEWVGGTEDFPGDAGACLKYKGLQVAVFNFARIGKWYACQNLCPHKMEMVIARGMIGEAGGVPKVACPMHKHNFSLEDGSCMTTDLPALATFPVKVVDGQVFVGFNI